MDIYHKPINAISWGDIEVFCEQGIPESHLLDYKQDFPERLQNTIAAMANTWGGVIIVGIEEDDQTKPKPPLKGVPFERGLPDRVTNIDLGNITPPVLPEIAVVLSPDETRAIIIVRVHQSHHTPHAIRQNTTVYFRTGNRNNPEQLADVERIAWLLNSREKSKMLLDSLYERAEERFVKIRSLAANRYPNVKNGAATMTLSIAPLFPKEGYKKPSEIRSVLTSIRVRAGEQFFGPIFPAADVYTMVQDGFLAYKSSEDGAFCHTELNSFGLLFYKQALMSVRYGFSLESDQIFSRLDEFLDSTELFYRAIGYNGPLDFRVMLNRILGRKLLRYELQDGRLGVSDEYTCIDPDIKHQEIVLAHLIKEKKGELIQNAVDRIGWGFNWNISPAILREYFDYVDIRRRS